MKTLSNTEVLKSFEVTFNGKLIPVKLLRLQASLAPEYFFFVTIGEEKMLLKRTYLNAIPVWIGGSALSHQETQLLGPEIEKQLGHPFPPPESNNPFEYKGDIQITKTKFLLGNIPAEKAKAPYSSNIVYRIYMSTLMIEVEKSFFFSKEGQWLLNSPNLRPEHFKAFTDLIDVYEGAKDNQ
jgi:hypothetical protein